MWIKTLFWKHTTVLLIKRTSATTSVISLWTCVNTVDFFIDAVHYMKPFTLCETRVFPLQVWPESHTGGANARHCIRNLLWEVWSLWENAKHGQIRWTSDQMDLLSASSMHLLQIANLNKIIQINIWYYTFGRLNDWVKIRAKHVLVTRLFTPQLIITGFSNQIWLFFQSIVIAGTPTTPRKASNNRWLELQPDYNSY